MSLRTCLALLALAGTPFALVAGETSPAQNQPAAADPYQQLTAEQMNEVAKAAASLTPGANTTITVGGVSVTIAKTSGGSVGLSIGGKAASMQVTNGENGALASFSVTPVGGVARTFKVATNVEYGMTTDEGERVNYRGDKGRRDFWVNHGASFSLTWVPWEIATTVVTEVKSSQTAIASGDASPFNP